MKIASFNVQRFGISKVSKPDVLSTLVKIVSQYDIILILEVVDVSGASVKLFLKELNRVCTTHHYTLQLSAHLGRSGYKEQFLFLYRDDVVTLIDSYQYEDNQANDVDAFAREPYILHFKPHNTVLKDIVLIPVHTTPSDSKKELDELYDVFLVVKDKWETDNIMILGDFNADGIYLSKKKMRDTRIRSDRDFHWLIGDEVDTTAKVSNNHTYDRIVVYGDDMLEAIVPNSAKSFNFHKEFGMTEKMALEVSDHYPVEVELRTSTRSQEIQQKQTENRAIKDTNKLEKNDKDRYDYVPSKGAKKSKKKKDPNAPKRPLSAFFVFCSDQRPKIKEENPNISICDIAKKLGEMWATQSAKDKASYESKAAKLKEKYVKDMIAYKAKAGAGQSSTGKKGGPGRSTPQKGSARRR